MGETCRRRVCGAILAAGPGTRMAGRTKQLIDLGGKPILQHAIDNAQSSSIDYLVIVLGHNSAEIIASIDAGTGRIVINPNFSAGQSSSLVTAIGAAPAGSDAVLILLGDQPGVTPAIIDRMADLFRRDAPLLMIPRYQGQRGNPVMIHRMLFPELQQLTGDIGARAVFDKHASDIEYVDFDFAAPPDIDTLADLSSVVQSYPG
jgi:molybdenum cofactor cytidylyltransferase